MVKVQALKLKNNTKKWKNIFWWAQVPGREYSQANYDLCIVKFIIKLYMNQK